MLDDYDKWQAWKAEHRRITLEPMRVERKIGWWDVVRLLVLGLVFVAVVRFVIVQRGMP